MTTGNIRRLMCCTKIKTEKRSFWAANTTMPALVLQSAVARAPGAPAVRLPAGRRRGCIRRRRPGRPAVRAGWPALFPHPRCAHRFTGLTQPGVCHGDSSFSVDGRWLIDAVADSRPGTWLGVRGKTRYRRVFCDSCRYRFRHPQQSGIYAACR